MRHLFFAVVLVAISLQGFEVTRNGKPAASIVISSTAGRPIVNAASELQKWIEAISGAKLPINGQADGIERRIHLTDDKEVLARFARDAAMLKGTEGYAVRCEEQDLYVLADCPKGVLNGIYQLLFRNTDIIWARPNEEFGTLYSANPNIDFSQTSWIDIPSFAMRGWQTRYGASSLEFLWAVRNRANWTSYSPGQNNDNDEYGMYKEAYFGHNVSGMYIHPDKYYKDHPDFYPEINGKRVTYEYAKSHWTQLCFSNPEMIKCFIKEFDARVAARPGSRMYGVFAEDNYDQCHCARCDADIILPDGTAVKKNEPDFYSTRFFLFLNQIAEHAKVAHPGILVSTYAYFFTEIPPRIDVADNIVVLTCPITKNVKFPMTAPENAVTYNKLAGWLKKTDKFILYDYFGLTRVFPRPADMAVAADYRFMVEHNITMSHSEIMSDNPKRTDPEKDLAIETWNCNSIYYWVMSQLAWDPYQDVNALRKEYLRRVFGAAADDVAEYLSYTERAWRSCPEPSIWNTNPTASWKSLFQLGLIEPCSQALKRAYSKNLTGKNLKMLDCLAKSFNDNPSLTLMLQQKNLLDAFNKHPENYPNLLQNPGFETLKDQVPAKGIDWVGSPFAYWSFWRDFNTGTYGVDSKRFDTPASGKHSAFFSDTPHAFYIQKIPVEEGQIYYLRCKAIFTASKEAVQLTARWQDKDSKWVCVSDNQDFYVNEPKPRIWQEYEGIVVVPKGATQLVYLMGSRSCKETIGFDDAELYRLK